MNAKKREPAIPIIRLRSVLGVVSVIAILIAGPLLIVWKQVYINNASLKLEQSDDSLVVLSREIASLKLSCERLSSTERIETIARTCLGLDYPLSNQIEIVEVRGKQGDLFDPARHFFSLLKKTILRDRG